MLDVRHLGKVFDAAQPVRAVHDVTLDVHDGELFTLLGPSGCGKTTTLRCVAGLETPDTGEIRIGEDLVFADGGRRAVRTERRDLAMVFQSYAVWPHMTVARNVAFPLEAERVPRREVARRVDEALALVGLDRLADRPAPQLSGGQQQRVALARALVRGAGLLLLDEPLSNLDAGLRVRMRSEIRDLQRRLSTTMLYVTHDQDEALSLSDRIAVMRDGEVVEVGRPRDLYLRPQHAFTAQFVGQADLLPARLIERRGDEVVVATPVGDLVSTQWPEDLGGQGSGVGPGSGGTSVLVRPEHMQVLGDDEVAPATNVLRATVVDAVFSGPLLDVVVAVGARRLQVRAISTLSVRPGDQVRLHVPPQRCVLLHGHAVQEPLDAAADPQVGDPVGTPG